MNYSFTLKVDGECSLYTTYVSSICNAIYL